MSDLLHKLGLSENLSFHDVFSIDDPDLLAFAPRPALALLLVFPVSATYERSRHEEDAEKVDYDGSGPGENVIWYKQTIGNACGLIGLLHAASNGSARESVNAESSLDTFIKNAIPLQPQQRAQLIEDSESLAHAHAEAAAGGETNAPSADDAVDLHFVCFVKSLKDGHLWELDGRRKGPLDRGLLSNDEDVLSPTALDHGVRAFLKREASNDDRELRFSLIVLAQSLD